MITQSLMPCIALITQENNNTTSIERPIQARERESNKKLK